MKRRIFFILLIFMMLGVLTYFYINNILLPVKIKNLLVKKAENLLHRDVSIGNLKYQLHKGVTISDVEIGQKENSNLTFISIPEISFNILITSFFKTKQIIIPSIKFTQPQIALERSIDGQFNFMDLLKSEESSIATNYSILLKKLIIKEAKISLKYHTEQKSLIETFSDVNININLTLKKEAQFDLSAQIPDKQSLFKLSGSYSLNEKELTALLDSENIPLVEYFPLTPTPNGLIINSGQLSTSGLNLKYTNGIWDLSGHARIAEADILFPNHQQIIGNADVTFKKLHYEEDLLNITGDLQLMNGRILLSSENTLQGEFMANIHHFTLTDKAMDIFGQFYIDNGLVNWQKNQFVKGKISLLNSSLKMFESQVEFETKIDAETLNIHLAENQTVSSQFETNQTKINFKDNLLSVHTDLHLKDTNAQWPENISFFGQIDSDALHLTLAPAGEMNLNSTLQLSNIHLQMNDGRSFKGSPQIQLNYKTDFSSEQAPSINGKINFFEGVLTGVPYLDNLQALAGDLTFDHDKIVIEHLQLKSQDIDFLLSGKLENFSKPAIQLNIESNNIRLEKFSNIFPEIKTKYKINLTGDSSFKAALNGPLTDLLNENLLVTTQLSNSSLELESLTSPIENIHGSIQVAKDLIKWDDLNLTFLNQPYTLNGFLRDFSRPKVRTDIKNKDLDMKAQFNILNQAFQITSAIGQYKNTKIDLKGDVHLIEKSAPKIDFRGNFDFELTDILPFLPQYRDKIDLFKPKGRFTGEGLIRGAIDDWRNWDLNFQAASPYLEIKDFNFDNLTLNYSQRDRHISQCDIYSKVYDGTLNITSSADLIDESIPFRMVTKLENLNLETLRSDVQLKFKEFSGNLNFLLNLNGPLTNYKKLTGDGSIHVSEGRIWQHKVIDNIWEALLIIPEFNNVIFSEAQAGFTIEKEKIISNSIFLKGNTIDISAKGWIGFDQKIQLEVHPKFSEITIAKSESLRKAPTALISQAIEYKCHGTLQYPKCEKTATLKKTTGMIKDSVGTIFEDVLPGIFEGIKGVVE
ncbi:MAG: DUF748 domain-containing protein [Candidatus Omnitrophica bacterium]|nr:DUF748 domain-containing protein [Candidatus Omnitrophota bacterium]